MGPEKFFKGKKGLSFSKRQLFFIFHLYFSEPQ
jgi:hypothetical protein